MKRRLLEIAVLLVLGAIVNVAVAWGCAMYSGPTCRFSRAEIDESWWKSDSLFTKHVEGIPVAHRRIFAGFGLRVHTVLELTTVHRGPRATGWNFEAGWPAISVEGQLWHLSETGGKQTIKQTVILADVISAKTLGLSPRRGDQLAFAADGRFLPTKPAFPGFALNTLFYAAILWLLFAAPFKLRRWRRIKRGLCATCAYDLRSSASSHERCPECGTISA